EPLDRLWSEPTRHGWLAAQRDAREEASQVAARVRGHVGKALALRGDHAAVFVVVDREGNGGARYDEGSYPELADGEIAVHLRNLTLRAVQHWTDKEALGAIGRKMP